MRPLLRLLTTALVAVLVGGVAAPTAVVPAAQALGTATETVAYGPHPRQTIQATWTESGPPRPAVVMLHGGHWTTGQRSDWDGYLAGLRDAGYQTFTPHYRLNTQAVWPAQRDDVAAALAYIRANTARYRTDPGRIFLMGVSAGGHLALTQGLAGDDRHVRGIIAVSAPANPWRAYVDGRRALAGPAARKLRANARALAGCAPVQNAVGDGCWGPQWRDAIAKVHASPNDPPTLLIQTTGDFVSYRHATETAAALRGQGVTVLTDLYRSRAHAGPLFDIPRVEPSIEGFLDRLSRPGGRPAASRTILFSYTDGRLSGRRIA